ncbi:MAG: Crp/Fnr family transcriptional regulator [Chloroflexota bacterium]
MISLTSRVQCLNAVEIFCDLSVEELAVISKRAPVRHLDSKTIIYSPEQLGEVLFMVNEGQVQIYHLAPDGQMITVAILESGTLFGEMAILGQSLYGNYAQTMTPAILCTMSVEDVKNILLTDLRISNRFLEALGKRLLAMQQHVSILTFKLMPQRVASLLLQMSDSGRIREIRCTHETLATMVGANRETVTKILNEFRTQNLIEQYRGRVVILDPTRLAAFENS